MTLVLGGGVKRGRTTPTQSTIPRRRVKSDDTIRSSTTRTPRERTINPEWTLFLGVPRNAALPPPLVPLTLLEGHAAVAAVPAYDAVFAE